MTYRGKMDGGVVVLDGDRPPDGAEVTVTLVNDVSKSVHPAIGIWKDRTDLPADSIEASKALREQMTRPRDE